MEIFTKILLLFSLDECNGALLHHNHHIKNWLKISKHVTASQSNERNIIETENIIPVVSTTKYVSNKLTVIEIV